MASEAGRAAMLVRTQIASAGALHRRLADLQESSTELSYIMKRYVPADFRRNKQLCNTYRRNIHAAVSRVVKAWDDLEEGLQLQHESCSSAEEPAL